MFSEPANSVQGVLPADANLYTRRIHDIGTCQLGILIMGFCFIGSNTKPALKFTIHYMEHIHLGDYYDADVHVLSFILCAKAGGITCS